MTRPKLPPWTDKVLLLAIFLVGAVFRFYNLDWDQGHFFHPDERNIAVAVSKIQFFSHLNPEFFAYNGFWIYLTRLLGTLYFDLLSPQADWAQSWVHVNLLTRHLSAFFSALSVILTFKLAFRLLKNTSLALYAAALSAFSVGYIQYAHFGVTESVLVFFVLLLSLLTLAKRWLWVAVVSALAVGTKTSAISFLLIPALGYLFELVYSPARILYLRRLPLYLGIFLVLLFLVTPYSFITFDKFLESMEYEGGVVSGRLAVPYTLQFLDTKPYLYPFTNLLWHLGPLVPVLGGLGLLTWLTVSVLTGATLVTPGLTFALVYFLYVGSWYTKFIRYLLPLYPFLIIAAVWLLHRLLGKLPPRFRFSLYSLVLAVSVLYSVAYLHVYIQESTRITASQWAFQNLPPDSTILTEHWDDRVPLDLEGYSANFTYIQLENYEPDSDSKITQLAQHLALADYVSLASRRLSGSIGKAPQKYPYTSRYYQLLFAEKLGYVLIKQFSVSPRIGPLIINDASAEESFQVYDHPTIHFFKNEKHLSALEIKELIKQKNPLQEQNTP